jgi:signal transduction histidine kinase
METTGLQLTDDFLLKLVHDCRSFVRRSLAGVQLIERSIAEGLDGSVRQRFGQVIAANKELDQFLGRLSDFANAAQPRSGRPLPLPAIVQSAILQFPGQAVEVSSPIPDIAGEANFSQEMIRVFVELIDNALKFSRNGPVTIQIVAGEDEFRVNICDSGVGLPASEEEHVFDLLNKLHSYDEYAGFGLGLPICRRLANSMGASVRLSANASGPGATATVQIPQLH